MPTPEKRLPFAGLRGMAGARGAGPAGAELGQGGAARCAEARRPWTGWVAVRPTVERRWSGRRWRRRPSTEP
jgi:hypothetical protein